MKKQLILTASIILASVLTFAQDIPDAPKDKAVVYFTQPYTMGTMYNFVYLDSATVIGKAAGSHYFRYECAPGHHVFWGKCEGRDFVEAELEAGRIYFLQAVPTPGMMKSGIKLKPVDPKDEKAMKRILKLMSSEGAKTTTPEDLAKMQKDQERNIELGLKQYAEDKGKSSKIEKLEKTAYYTKTK